MCSNNRQRKIIHIDMDCFFAAIEMRDNPRLKNKPIAVGGAANRRGVLSTCNYIARKYGLHSAMPTAKAIKLCPQLILLPVNIEKYQKVSSILERIFRQYTPLVEMLSLDEAFLDVTNCPYCKGSATLIARAIKARIKKILNLTASAGAAPNKFLAKVASDWQKPDGLFVITPEQISEFVKTLPVKKIYGVGKVTEEKLKEMGIFTCADLQKLSLDALTARFGKFGIRMYQLCRGVDDQPVEVAHIRKSLSVEETYPYDLITLTDCSAQIPDLIQKLNARLQYAQEYKINKQFVKIKFFDFTHTTVEQISDGANPDTYYKLLTTGYNRQKKAVRLLGVGVGFAVGK